MSGHPQAPVSRISRGCGCHDRGFSQGHRKERQDLQFPSPNSHPPTPQASHPPPTLLSPAAPHPSHKLPTPTRVIAQVVSGACILATTFHTYTQEPATHKVSPAPTALANENPQPQHGPGTLGHPVLSPCPHPATGAARVLAGPGPTPMPTSLGPAPPPLEPLASPLHPSLARRASFTLLPSPLPPPLPSSSWVPLIPPLFLLPLLRF